MMKRIWMGRRNGWMEVEVTDEPVRTKMVRVNRGDGGYGYVEEDALPPKEERKGFLAVTVVEDDFYYEEAYRQVLYKGEDSQDDLAQADSQDDSQSGSQDDSQLAQAEVALAIEEQVRAAIARIMIRAEYPFRIVKTRYNEYAAQAPDGTIRGTIRKTRSSGWVVNEDYQITASRPQEFFASVKEAKIYFAECLELAYEEKVAQAEDSQDELALADSQSGCQLAQDELAEYVAPSAWPYERHELEMRILEEHLDEYVWDDLLDDIEREVAA